MEMKLRTMRFSCSERKRPRIKSGISAGTKVTEKSAVPIRAKVLVYASG